MTSTNFELAVLVVEDLDYHWLDRPLLSGSIFAEKTESAEQILILESRNIPDQIIEDFREAKLGPLTFLASDLATRITAVRTQLEGLEKTWVIKIASDQDYSAVHALDTAAQLGATRQKLDRLVIADLEMPDKEQQNSIAKGAICEFARRITPELLDHLRDNPQVMDEFSPHLFEDLVMALIERMGFLVEAAGTTYAKDGGIDFVAIPRQKTALSTVIGGQVKHHRAGNKTGVADVDRLLAWRGAPFQIGLLVTNTGFTIDALFKASMASNSMFVRLRNREDINRWLNNDFESENEMREIPDVIQLTPTLKVRVPKNVDGSTFRFWPLTSDWKLKNEKE